MGSSPLPVSLQNKLARSPAVSRLKSLSTNLALLRNIIFILFLLRWSRKSFYFLRGHGIIGSISYAYAHVYKAAYRLILSAPGLRAKVDKQVATAIKGIEDKLAPQGPGVTRYLTLPKEPWTTEQLQAELGQLAEMKRTRWEDGQVSGAVYHGGGNLLEIQAHAMKLFSVANPIHADVFPAVRKMEAEVVAMVLSMFNAPAEGAGTTTSGGTESILMACLSARQKAYTERGVTEPEMVIPSTAHAAFHKAASYFKITLRIAPCPAPSYKVSISSMRRLISPNTILLVGSCPNYPQGIIDDISALSRLALAHKIPLHVDCCLGSFLIPHLALAGVHSIPSVNPASAAAASSSSASADDSTSSTIFDFRLPGVTSISVDTHKYGFAPKGNSVILYRNRQLRSYQYFLCADWSGGVYASPSMAGSRAGALIAGCWASLMSLGEKGYIDATHRIIGARVTIQNAIVEHPVLRETLRVMGDPKVSVVAFDSADPGVSIYDVADGMSAKGWHLNSLQNPPGCHVAVTMPIVEHGVDKLIEDLVAVVEDEKAKAERRLRDGEGAEVLKKGSAGALYGVAGSLPDMTIVDRLLVGYMDTLYKA